MEQHLYIESRIFWGWIHLLGVSNGTLWFKGLWVEIVYWSCHLYLSLFTVGKKKREKWKKGRCGKKRKKKKKKGVDKVFGMVIDSIKSYQPPPYYLLGDFCLFFSWGVKLVLWYSLLWNCSCSLVFLVVSSTFLKFISILALNLNPHYILFVSPLTFCIWN